MSKSKVGRYSLSVRFINLMTGRKEAAIVKHTEQQEFWKRQRAGQISIIAAKRRRT